jgi:hypothetical protein
MELTFTCVHLMSHFKQKIHWQCASLYGCLLFIADSIGAYAGALSLLHALSLADLDVKLEAARKILTATFMKASAPHHFARQVQTFSLLAVGFVFVSVLVHFHGISVCQVECHYCGHACS